MAAKKQVTEEAVAEEAAAEKKVESKFSKKQLMNSKDFRNRKDALNVLLKEDQTYTKSEAKALLNEFMSRKIK